YVAEDASRQRRLDENQRLVGKSRMEEGVASPVFFETPPQIVPALDLMNGLVLNEALENQGRRAPIDSLQDEEAAIEPRTKQVFEVGVDGGSFRVLRERAQHIRAHPHQQAGAAGSGVEAPEQLLPARFRRGLERRETRVRPIPAVGIDGKG